MTLKVHNIHSIIQGQSIDYKCNFIGKTVENKIVNVKYVPTNEVPVDYFKKAVSKIKHFFVATGSEFKTNTI